MNKILMILVFIGCSASACKKERPAPTEPGLVKLKEAAVSGNRKVVLFADRAQLTVGYNPIYIRIEDASGATDKQADIGITPLMDMHTMQHSSPVEQPEYDVSLDLHAGAVVFTMPSGDMGAWKLTVDVDGERVDLDVTITEAPAGIKTVHTLVGKDGASYTITLVQPQEPAVGMNDLEILVNSREDMLRFPPVSGLAVTFHPEMPSMGHGSPNNADPMSTGNGRYWGKVNFTMTGDWRLHFSFARDGEVIVEDAYFDLLF